MDKVEMICKQDVLDTIEKDINFYDCEPYTEANFKETY